MRAPPRESAPDAPVDPVVGRDVPWPSRLAQLVASKTNALLGTMLAGVGGIALVVGWHAGPQKIVDANRYATLTGRAHAQVVDRWLAIETDRLRLDERASWQSAALATPCVVVEYTPPSAPASRRAFCGTRLPLDSRLEPSRLTELTSGVPFTWRRDARGFIEPEIRMSGEAIQASNAPRAAQTPGAGPGSAEALTALRLAFEAPVDGALAGWGVADIGFPVAFDPSDPTRSWPASVVDDDARRAPDLVTAIAGAIVGLLFWWQGMRLLTARVPRTVAVFVTVAPLLLLPWWGEHFARTLRWMNASFAPVVGGLIAEVDRFDRLVASAPDVAALAQSERMTWPVDGGDYAGVFADFTLRTPSPAPADPDAALLALNDTIAAQMRAFDEPTRSRILERLAQDKREGRTRAGYAFLRAARATLADRTGSPAARARAHAFLAAWVTQPVDDPDPGAIAFDARIVLLRELMSIPAPNDVAIPAEWIVQRALARRNPVPIPRSGG